MKRKSEMWVSNNRVLNSAVKKDPGRNPNFDVEETKLLISLWGDPKTQRTLVTTHRKHIVIAKLAEKMCEYGYNRSTEEINTRIKNLKCFYNRIKKDIDMGGTSTWKHYDAMDAIMTRSIFSVRPNEVPKPSLKYQLEAERREQEEKRVLRAPKIITGESSLPRMANIEHINIINAADESQDKISEQSAMDYMEINDDDRLKIKEEDDPDSDDVVETPLVIPKEEPINVDAQSQRPDDVVCKKKLFEMKRLKIKHKNEKWVSNNRVLFNSSKRDPGRNPNFDTEETKLLITLWGDPKLQRTLITTHRKYNVISKLADKMSEYGYKRSPEEINTRIKNLKCFYNRLKKDMDSGAINGSSWKHFAAMDEIMTQSIFSVRPDEIPKPSLKYQLEVEQSEKEESMKSRAEIAKASKSSFSNAQNSEENSFDSNVSEAEVFVENDARVNCDDTAIMEYMEDDNNFGNIKEKTCTDPYSKDIEETPLIIPKDEPLDDDDDVKQQETEIINNAEAPATIVPDYIQLPNSNVINQTHRARSLLNSNNLNGALQTSPTPAVVPQSILISNQANSISNTGKISLVPTNFLLQQNAQSQPQPIQIRQQPQQRIICTQPNVQTNNGIVTSQGGGRMKVLLVNAFQNGKTTGVTTANEGPFVNGSLMQSSNIQTTNTSEPMVLKNSAETSKSLRTEVPPSVKDIGMEILFNKLILMQTENNEIQRQRLQIERERLEFEKSIANKLLTALTSLNQVQKPANINTTITNEKSANVEEYILGNSHPPDLLDEIHNYQLLTPKVEKED